MYDSSIQDWRSATIGLITSGINSGLRIAGLESQLIGSSASKFVPDVSKKSGNQMVQYLRKATYRSK